MKKLTYLYLLLLLLRVTSGYGQLARLVTVHTSDQILSVTTGLEILQDPGHNLSIDSVANSRDFKLDSERTPNLQVSSSAWWVRLKIRNETDQNRLLLKLSYPELDSLNYYEPNANGTYRVVKSGQSLPFYQRQHLSTDYLFTVNVAPQSEETIYLRITNTAGILLPLSIGPVAQMNDFDKFKDVFWGMYIGLMLAMLLYNCFVYITTKDSSYLYYIAYVLAVILTQTNLSGYTFQFLWPGSAWLGKYSAFLTPAFVGLTSIEFMRHFLKTKMYVPKADKIFIVFISLYVLATALCFLGIFNASWQMMNITASSVSIYMLVIATVISRKGYRPAVFFLISWIVFLIGVFIFVFVNTNILPYNNFTVNTMPVGSAMEVLLLSFALADRINILKKEKEASQAQTILAVQENERIVREQNVMLEVQVNERTYELKLSNDDLNKALTTLKEAQTQLVESEKMASLGQLTAGIAHEINNPINFVTSNVKPLDRDVRMLLSAIDVLEKIASEDVPIAAKQKKIEDYKQELDYDYLTMEINQLLKGISDGASRTAEIVKGLRIFSRLDEDTLKKADVNEGLDSTLVITNNLLGTIKLEKSYANLPLIDCYPGKLNQVFLNIISNAIYAIKKKFNGQVGGALLISTSFDEQHAYIKIKDNGTGMDANTKKRLFEPFFTTKDVGEGTGLGMSISFNTINKHNGHIHVNSEMGVGTEFIIELPLTQK